MSVQICCPLFNWIVLVFSIELHEFLCILDINPLSDVMICKYFLLFRRLSFHSVMKNVPLLGKSPEPAESLEIGSAHTHVI